MKLRDVNLQVNEKTLSHILLHLFCLHFLRIHYNYFFQRVFESVRAQFLSGNISGLLVIYLFNYNSSKSTPCWICNWTFSWVQFLSNKLELVCFLQCNDYKKILLFALCIMLCVLISTFFYENLIVLHHGDNNFLFYLDIWIKFSFINNLKDKETTTSHLMCTFLW